jgi:hypothetical protein
MHLRFPYFGGQPNGIALADAQVNYAMTGFPSTQFERDPEWRAIDRDVDEFADPPVDFDGLTEPEDATVLYYWLPAYWQRVP